LTIAAEYPHQITAATNFTTGYVESICVECSNVPNGLDIFRHEVYNLTQRPNCEMIEHAERQPNDTVLTFNGEETTAVIGDWF